MKIILQENIRGCIFLYDMEKEEDKFYLKINYFIKQKIPFNIIYG